MRSGDYVIATITWARDEAEENLLRAALTQLATLQVLVYITDGGSRTSFLDFLHQIPHFRVLTCLQKGVWAQARTSLAAAYQAGHPFIFYTEPDKLIFFQDHVAEFLRAASCQPATGVVLAARSAAGFHTFPEFQQTTETTINACCAEITGVAVDYTYGPFLFNRQLAPYLNQVQEDIGWGWRPYIFGLAHRLGYHFQVHEADLVCPPEQRTDTPAERIYRMRQLAQNIQGLVLSTTVAVKNPLNQAP